MKTMCWITLMPLIAVPVRLTDCGLPGALSLIVTDPVMVPTTVGEKLTLRRHDEYEYSSAPEYDKSSMSSKAVTQGTLDFDYDKAQSAVELSTDGAWVSARVWVPKQWLDDNRPTGS
jgi:hypothetical protein